MSYKPWVGRLAAATLVSSALVLMIVFFDRLPIEGTSLALDWKRLWLGLQGGRPQYGNATGLRIAPWDVLVVLPLGWLSFRASWGVLTLATIGVLVLSIPPFVNRPWRWLSVVLLTTSFPALRHIADGNFEALIIAGVLLALHGYASHNWWTLAAGILLATAKVQETWLLMPVLGLYLLRAWPIRHLIILGSILAAIVVPSLVWIGREWLEGMAAISERGSIMDVSLSAALNRLGLPSWLVIGGWAVLASSTLYTAWVSERRLSREKAAMLIAASLLLSPYAAGNSFLTVLAIGIMPFFIAGHRMGVLLMILTNLPYLATRDMLFRWQAYYWTVLLFLTWGLCLAHVLQTEARRPAREP